MYTERLHTIHAHSLFSLFTSYPYTCTCMYDIPPELHNSESGFIQKDSKGNLFLSPSKVSPDGVCAFMHMRMHECVYGVECIQLLSTIFLCSEFTESGIYAFTYNRILRCTGFKVYTRRLCYTNYVYTSSSYV